MPHRPSKFNLKTGVFVALVGVSMAGAAYLTLGPTRPIAKVVRPAATARPAAQVAGASVAPTSQAPDGEAAPSPVPSASNSGLAAPTVSTASSASNHSAASAPAATTPVPVQHVTLVVAAKTGTINASVTYTAGMDACSILDEAKAEGKIASFTADASYLKTLHSLMITEINGYSGIGWLYSVKDAAGNIIHDAPGCSINALQPGYTVTWKPA